MELHNSYESITIEVKTVKGSKIISKQKIVFIEANKKNTIIRIDSGQEDDEIIISINPLKWFLQKLEPPDFYRCHKSFLINCHYVDCFCNKA